MICELELPRKPAVAVVAGSQGSPCHCGGFSIGLEGSIMFRSQIGPAILPEDMVEYLNERVRQNGISLEEAYRAEMAAREELARITPSYDELASLAKRFPPPQEWYDE
jgi:hypothetical protein